MENEDRVTYTIEGTIKGSDGSESSFVLHADHGNWSQWGNANRDQLWERVKYLDAMAGGLGAETNYYQQETSD